MALTFGIGLLTNRAPWTELTFIKLALFLADKAQESSARNQKKQALVTRRNNPRTFHHEYHCLLRRPRTMLHSLRNHVSLPRSQFHRAVAHLDNELAFHHIEELIFIVVFMPVILALDHSQTYH